MFETTQSVHRGRVIHVENWWDDPWVARKSFPLPSVVKSLSAIPTFVLIQKP